MVGWLDAADATPKRTEGGFQPTGKLASSQLKDDNLSRGGRAQHNGRSDNWKIHHMQESENRSYCFARMAFPTQIQCISNTCRNANPGNENGAHDEAGAHLVHQRKKADPA